MGGWKYPECDVWAGAFNHADLKAVLDHIAQMPWRCPNALRVFMMDQEKASFRVSMLRDDELRQYAPVVPNEEANQAPASNDTDHHFPRLRSARRISCS
ncbi:hypothetical protein GCM10009555_040110 [Acrocarpospora macrocephala]|uniref:Uncharacterized protein n=1 Tax=Acrocarpospora macrocephala TaxID=150177 RepID=A0A5M3WMZ5_9ACTN|nr:hypothetical protein Amac_036130 [Acrocarpospora macrocephala]